LIRQTNEQTNEQTQVKTIPLVDCSIYDSQSINQSINFEKRLRTGGIFKKSSLQNLLPNVPVKELQKSVSKNQSVSDAGMA